MTRHEFSPAKKRAALEAAGHRCQDPLCGVSDEWNAAIWAKLAGAQMWTAGVRPAWPFPFALADLVEFRDAILAARFKHRRALNPIIKRFQLAGTGALLQIDHEDECADGGGAAQANATVRCVFCHYFKTRAREHTRLRAPKKAPPEQSNLITRATVIGLQGTIDAVKTASRLDGAATPVSHRIRLAGSRQPARRHYTDAQVTEAVQRRQQAIEDNWFGV